MKSYFLIDELKKYSSTNTASNDILVYIEGTSTNTIFSTYGKFCVEEYFGSFIRRKIINLILETKYVFEIKGSIKKS